MTSTLYGLESRRSPRLPLLAPTSLPTVDMRITTDIISRHSDEGSCIISRTGPCLGVGAAFPPTPGTVSCHICPHSRTRNDANLRHVSALSINIRPAIGIRLGVLFLGWGLVLLCSTSSSHHLTGSLLAKLVVQTFLSSRLARTFGFISPF